MGILALGSAYIPFFSLVALLFSSSLATIFSFLIRSKYIPLYLSSSLALVFLCGFSDIASLLFFLIPGLISGSLSGYLFKIKWHLGLTLALISIVFSFSSWLGLQITNLLSGVDFLLLFLNFLGIAEIKNIQALVPLFLFAYSLFISSISYLFLTLWHKKVQINFSFKRSYCLYSSIAILASSFSLGIVFLDVSTGFFFLGLALYFGIISFLEVERPRFFYFFTHTILIVISFYAFTLLHGFYGEALSLTLFALFSLTFSLLNLLHAIVRRRIPRSKKEE